MSRRWRAKRTRTTSRDSATGAGVHRPLPLLGWTGHARPAGYVQRQAAGERESGQQEALLAIDPQASAGPGPQRRGTAPVGEWDRQPTQGEQVQTADEREGITVQSHVTAPLRAGLCRGGTGA
jgi:hypothetical protein